MFYTCCSLVYSLPYMCLPGFRSLECRVECYCLEGPMLELEQAMQVNRIHRQCSSPQAIVQPPVFSMHLYAYLFRQFSQAFLPSIISNLISLNCWSAIGLVQEYTCGAISSWDLYLGDLPPLNAVSNSALLFYIPFPLSYPLQDRNKFSTQKGVVQVLLVPRTDSLPFRPLENWALIGYVYSFILQHPIPYIFIPLHSFYVIQLFDDLS